MAAGVFSSVESPIAPATPRPPIPLNRGSKRVRAKLSRKRWFLFLSVLLTAGALVLGIYDFTFLRSKQERTGTERRSLGVKAERVGGDLKLIWNPFADSLKNASQAELQIDDGPHQNRLLLTRSQVRGGTVLRISTPGTFVVRGALLWDTPVDLRIPVDSYGRPVGAVSETTAQNGGVLHHLARLGKKTARLWPFHNREESESR